jgi:branched-subunit amino acid transport protein AzlD
MNDRRNTWTLNGGRKHLWIRLSIWSLKRHDDLIAVLRMVMMAFPYVVLLAVFAGRLDLETALRVIGFGALAVVVLITGLVLTRRNVLLGIDDPDLRSEAHQAMLALIRSRVPIHTAGRAQVDREAPTNAARCAQTGECNR